MSESAELPGSVSSERHQRYEQVLKERSRIYKEVHNISQKAAEMLPKSGKVDLAEVKSEVNASQLSSENKLLLGNIVGRVEKRQQSVIDTWDALSKLAGNEGIGLNEAEARVGKLLYSSTGIKNSLTETNEPAGDIVARVGTTCMEMYVTNYADFESLHKERLSGSVKGFFDRSVRLIIPGDLSKGLERQMRNIPIAVIFASPASSEAKSTVVHETGHAINDIVMTSVGEEGVGKDIWMNREYYRKGQALSDIKEIENMVKLKRTRIPILRQIAERVAKAKISKFNENVIGVSMGKAKDEVLAVISEGRDLSRNKDVFKGSDYDYFSHMGLNGEKFVDPEVKNVVDSAKNEYLRRLGVQISIVDQFLAKSENALKRPELLTLLRATPIEKWSAELRRQYGFVVPQRGESRT